MMGYKVKIRHKKFFKWRMLVDQGMPLNAVLHFCPAVYWCDRYETRKEMWAEQV
jgi:hypothetical protein